jgi:hypothetical protein
MCWTLAAVVGGGGRGGEDSADAVGCHCDENITAATMETATDDHDSKIDADEADRRMLMNHAVKELGRYKATVPYELERQYHGHKKNGFELMAMADGGGGGCYRQYFCR